MKNAIILFSLAAILFYSCAKDGATGPAGQNGTNGTNGNANVHSYFVSNPSAAQWTYVTSYNEYYYDFAIPQITDEIIRKGTVDVFFGGKIFGTNDSSLTPLPNTSHSSSFTEYWTFDIRPGEVEIYFGRDPGTTPNPGPLFGDAFFKFVVIDGQRIKNPDDIPSVSYYNFKKINKCLPHVYPK